MAERLSHYTLVEQVGTGGMGTVYRATDERSGAVVALKTLHPHLAADAEYVRRFEREARIARSIDSPNVVRVLDSGNEGKTYFLVMEYVEGETLADYVNRVGQLPVGEAVRLARDVAHGLSVAHEMSIVHRDISPQNIMLTPEGLAKVTDFGISRDLTRNTLTATSLLMGKPLYIAPEVVTGSARADIRADIYALGVVLYQMLAGVVPFDAETPFAVMQKHVTQAVPDLRQIRLDVPLGLAEIVERCLAKTPTSRYPVPLDLIAALDALGDVSRITPEAGPLPAANTTVVCRRCHRPLLAGQDICPDCGHRREMPVEVVTRLDRTGHSGSPEAKEPSLREPTAARRVLVVTGLTGAVLVLVAIWGILIFGRGNDVDGEAGLSSASTASTQGTLGRETPTNGSSARPSIEAVASGNGSRQGQPQGTIPTITPLTNGVCSNVSAASDADRFKGCRVYEAVMDGTTTSFRPPVNRYVCGNERTPSVFDSEVRFLPGVLELELLRARSGTFVDLTAGSRSTYFAEYDLAFAPGSETQFLLGLLTAGNRSMMLQLDARKETVNLSFWDGSLGVFTDHSNDIHVVDLRAGRRLILAVAVDNGRYTVFLDGKTVIDQADNRIVGTYNFHIRTQGCGSPNTTGKLLVYGIRVYELQGR